VGKEKEKEEGGLGLLLVGPSFFLDFLSHSNSRVPKPYLSSIPKGIFELKTTQ
jgi:hypothetical protein